MKIFGRGFGGGAVLLHSLLIISVYSFQQSMTLISRTGHSFECHPHCFRDRSILNLKEDSLNGDEDDVGEFSGIPQLPAFGASSFSNPVAMTEDTVTGNGASNSKTDGEAFGKAAFVSPKFKLQYTCNICETRNSHMVSRLAYREGVVIAICKGCKSKHLIADNLNETPGMDGGSNIEDYFRAQGLEDSVNRVTPEVFSLENILRFDSTSGALVGEDGDPVLE